MDEFVVSLAGEFDICNARQIGDRVAEVLAEKVASRIVLDLKGVTFMDCAGIRSILYAQRLAGASGRDLVVRHPAPMVAESIRVLGLASQLYEHRSNSVRDVRERR
jgi:anti-sigma B factor antagonist